jgi:hypothetical protein
MCGLLLAAGLLLLVVPTLDGPHSHQIANEAAAVSKVRTVVTLQDRYAAAHAYNGFACELSQLKPTDQRNEADYDPLRFLTTGTQSGYKFSLLNCGSDATEQGPTIKSPLFLLSTVQQDSGLSARTNLA